jgi:hypothetical protein
LASIFLLVGAVGLALSGLQPPTGGTKNLESDRERWAPPIILGLLGAALNARRNQRIRGAFLGFLAGAAAGVISTLRLRSSLDLAPVMIGCLTLLGLGVVYRLISFAADGEWLNSRQQVLQEVRAELNAEQPR